MGRFFNVLDLLQQTAPASPAAGRNKLYVGTDDLPRILDSAGAERILVAPQIARKTADQNISTTAFADVTDLTFPVVSGKRYRYEFRGAYTTAATTTGIAFSVNGPTIGADGLLVEVMFGLSSATSMQSEAMTAYDTATASTAAHTAALPFKVSGFLHAGASGTLALRIASEVAASNVTPKKNSFGHLWVIG